MKEPLTLGNLATLLEEEGADTDSPVQAQLEDGTHVAVYGVSSYSYDKHIQGEKVGEQKCLVLHVADQNYESSD